MSFYQIAHLPGHPSRWTLIAWAKPDYPCPCGWHGWHALREKYSAEEAKRLLAEAEADPKLDEDLKAMQKLQEFIDRHRPELAPVLRRIHKVFGVRTDGRLTGNLHVDMIVTGYLLVLKVREAIVNIKIDDAYQLIQLMRTVISLFKEWGLPTVVEKEVKEVLELKLREYEKPDVEWAKDEERAVAE